MTKKAKRLPSDDQIGLRLRLLILGVVKVWGDLNGLADDFDECRERKAKAARG